MNNMLPKLLVTKIYKTGQTRGADDDVIYQNRVGRNSTVLIRYSSFSKCNIAPDNKGIFENGFIVLIKPEEYFETDNISDEMKAFDLKLGLNALVFYETREQWNKFNPNKKRWKPAESRITPLGGQYVARVPSITSRGAKKLFFGFTGNKKGAGIRVEEYASSNTIMLCRIQLEYLFWSCHNVKTEIAAKAYMTKTDIEKRIAFITKEAHRYKLDDNVKLKNARIINSTGNTICPLCLEVLNAEGFLSRLKLAEGRDVPDLTVTQINLFHIKELRIGEFNHKPYNLGWGHHYCNMITRDEGIENALKWMNKIIVTNKSSGYTI
jgi:hypothetical protein